AVLYFTVSGGPFGLEGLVGAVGPGLALLLLVLTPLIYSVPEALLIGELASMLPLEGGYYQWVKRAFGPFTGFVNGWLSWVYSLIDMAIYPVLFVQYARWFAPELSGLGAWGLALALIWGATWLNLRGTRVVGSDGRVWRDGAWPDIAAGVLGPWLAAWLAAAGMISAFALFNALLLSYSRIPLVLAQDGLLPAPLGRTDARGTPRGAVIASAVAYSGFVLLTF